ncbi:hypothetical protein Ga0466249_004042 [Sporomusaceae bacterium BoRhaA]|uniref:hypothetical protein n=1 Tax=Pelorhabdus rhamnosifermentans TaxID=2772457 RepID=UPI001C05EF3F|nr:hypothetical protein [Pelorhabdus rhamnosifermentans]MBU2702907.1 hypothetical protein [Pelorhabdus rhamnosifermentans]
MNEVEKQFISVMDKYDHGELEVIDVAIAMVESCGLCSKKVYERADMIFKNNH